MRLAFLIWFAIAGMASAEWCHDFWFTRNLVMDRAGYCFGSVLGQSAFDNSDCTGKQVSLSSGSARLVAEIQALEAYHGCRVNTSQPVLYLDDAAIRRVLYDLPIRDEFESACIGWLGSVTPLFAGHSNGSPVIGTIGAGDNVNYSHVPVGSWTYVTISGADWVIKGGGWLDLSTGEAPCRDYAG